MVKNINYNKEFKEEALKLSDEIGVKKAATQLGLKYDTLVTCSSSNTRASTMKKELCVDTLQHLKNGYGKQLSGAIIHSDRGSQYTSFTFREEVRNMSIIQSQTSFNPDGLPPVVYREMYLSQGIAA